MTRGKEYYEKNREKLLATKKASYIGRRKAQLVERQQKYNEQNRERVNASNRRSYQENKAAILTQKKQYRSQNRDKLRILEERREMRETGAFVEDIDRNILYTRDGGICQLCHLPVERSAMHIDHLLPLSRGGLHSYANTQIAHPKCNLAKGDRYISTIGLPS